MEIRRATNDDLESLYKFNSIIFPEKSIDSKDYIGFWLSRCSDAINHIWLVLDDSGNIVGQDFLSPMSYYYNGTKHESFWGFDLIVEEQYRKEAWGAFLMFEIVQAYKRKSFSTGAGPNAYDLNMKLGFVNIGEIYKFIGVVSFVGLFASNFRRKLDTKEFPEVIRIKQKKYRLILEKELPSLETTFNPDLLEFVRDREYMRWRFFNNLHDYKVYKDCDSDDYFVLRTTLIHNVPFMQLVDYRCKIDDDKDFRNIIRAAIKITRKKRIGLLLTGSSHKTIDKVLKSHLFLSIGRPRPIIAPKVFSDRKKDIEDRSLCLVTFADSDGETNWI